MAESAQLQDFQTQPVVVGGRHFTVEAASDGSVMLSAPQMQARSPVPARASGLACVVEHQASSTAWSALHHKLSAPLEHAAGNTPTQCSSMAAAVTFCSAGPMSANGTPQLRATYGATSCR